MQPFSKLYSSDSEVLSESEDMDDDTLTKQKKRRDITSEESKFVKHGFTTTWGPEGFKKKLHPLSIMVHRFPHLWFKR